MSMGMVNKDTAATIPAAGNTGDKVGNLAALHTTSKSDIVAAVNEVKDEQANKADMDIVADAFSAAETYAEGDYCTYEGGLYKFKTAHEGAWDAADVDQIKIAGELSELKNTLTSVDIISKLTIASGVIINSAVKNGNMVTISGSSMPIPSAGLVQLCTIDDIPTRSAQRVIGSVAFASPSDVGTGYLILENDGTLNLFFDRSTTYGICFTINYPMRGR